MTTLGQMRANGDGITAYCIPTHDNRCRHTAALDMEVLIAVFGDGEVSGARICRSLLCTKCGRHNAEIRINQASTHGAGVGSWNHGPGP
jgi:hypothetical protein